MSACCSLLYCDSYDYEKVHAAIEKSIQNLGGLDRYITPGERVLLKPNLLMKKKPEEATTTHPSFVKALAQILMEHGATVVIGDSPGGPFTSGLLNGVYKATGMSTLAQETGALLNSNFNSCQMENPNGLIMKRLTMTDMLNDVDKVICVAKLKTHGMMTFTGATKNMFGMVPGITKSEYHLNIPDYDHFSDMLIDVCICSNPVLSFIDGIVGMEGHGPSAGTPKAVNVVMASESPYHLDQVACHIIRLSTDDVPMLRRLEARGMISELSEIELLGDPIDKFIMPTFEIVKAKSPLSLHDSDLPGFIKKFAAKHMQSRPVIQYADCTGCAICQEACPAKIVDMVEMPQKVDSKNQRKAVIAYEDCIRCYCCQELCPQKAITIYKPTIVKLMRL